MKWFPLALLLFPIFCFAQPCRYDLKIFPAFNKTSNVIYATSPGIPGFYLGESLTTSQNLTTDIFQPAGDTATKRALIIFAHSGGFINGTKDNEDMQALCDSFVQRGFVTASMNYRLNFNLFSSSSAERAVWRGTQDGSALVRFFKANAAAYNIDTNKIFFWGSSAGSFIALNLAYMEDAERPASTFTSPDLGCKDCSGIVSSHTSGIAGIVSCWGAIGDTNWIGSNNTIPSLMFHGTADGTVPFIQGNPFGLGTLPVVLGSKLINDRLNKLSVYHEFYPVTGEDHEYWGTSNGSFTPSFPTTYWKDIIDKAKLYMLGRMGLIACNALAINFVSFNAYANDNTVRLRWQMEENVGTGSSFDIQFSEDAQQWETIQTLVVRNAAQRSFVFNDVVRSSKVFYRLILHETNGDTITSHVVYVSSDAVPSVDVFPNPANGPVNVRLNGELSNCTLTIYDAKGMLVKKINASSNNAVVSIRGLDKGIYIVRVIQNKVLGKATRFVVL